MGKGSTRRPAQVSRELEELRWMLAMKYITFDKYKRGLQKLKRKSLVKRRQ